MLYHYESGYRIGAGFALAQKDKLKAGTLAELRRLITEEKEPPWARLAALDAYSLILAKEKKKN